MNILQKCRGLISVGRTVLKPHYSATSLIQNKFLSTEPEKSVVEQEPAPQKDKLFPHVEVEVRGIDPAVMTSYSTFATTAANHLGITVGKCWAQRKANHERKTLLKSVHIYKKHRVQYEVRTYFRFMNFHNLTQSTLESFLSYIEANLPEGCALKVTKVEMQQLPEHLKEALAS